MCRGQPGEGLPTITQTWPPFLASPSSNHAPLSESNSLHCAEFLANAPSDWLSKGPPPTQQLTKEQTDGRNKQGTRHNWWFWDARLLPIDWFALRFGLRSVKCWHHTGHHASPERGLQLASRFFFSFCGAPDKIGQDKSRVWHRGWLRSLPFRAHVRRPRYDVLLHQMPSCWVPIACRECPRLHRPINRHLIRRGRHHGIYGGGGPLDVVVSSDPAIQARPLPRHTRAPPASLD